jgi:hypothetical protein
LQKPQELAKVLDSQVKMIVLGIVEFLRAATPAQIKGDQATRTCQWGKEWKK